MLAAKYYNWKIRLGSVKKVCSIKRFDINVRPFSGYCSWKSTSKDKNIVALIGGLLVSFILMIVLSWVKNKINSVVT